MSSCHVQGRLIVAVQLVDGDCSYERLKHLGLVLLGCQVEEGVTIDVSHVRIHALIQETVKLLDVSRGGSNV